MQRYFSSAQSNIKDYAAKYGQDGISELNTLADKHSITLEVDDTGTHNYGGCDIKDGKLRILFNAKYLGTNISSSTYELDKAVNSAPQPASTAANALNFDARQSIKLQWEPEVDKVKTKIDEQLGAGVSLTLSPNFDANYAVLAAAQPEPRSGWQKDFGKHTLLYFEALATSLGHKGFAKDDLLQEGFQEVIDKNEVSFRVVDKLTKGTYHEMFHDGGVLYIQVRLSFPLLVPSSSLTRLLISKSHC